MGSHWQPTKWNGRWYDSTRAAARAAGKNKDTMARYRRKGWTCDYDVMYPQAKRVVWNGREFNSVAEAARRTYVSRTTMHRYLSEGWTCDEDIVDRRVQRG